MNIQNKLKIGIGTVAVLLIAFYTYCLFMYGGQYINGLEYIVQMGMGVLFIIPILIIAKFLTPHKKFMSFSLIGIISLLGILIIPDVMGTTIKYNSEMLVIALWPLICYAIAKYVNVGRLIGYREFMCDCIAYNIIIAGLIWLCEETAFSYDYFSVDVIAEAYMYVMAIITFMLYNIKVRKCKVDIWDIFCLVVTVAIVIELWKNNQERIAWIVDSLNYGKTEVDYGGELRNWIALRMSMLKISLNGDFSAVSIYRIYPMIKGCSVAWLSSVGGWHIPAIIFSLNSVLACLLVAYACKKRDVLVNVVTISFLIKMVVGFAANLYLTYSTMIGVLLVRNIYDIIVLAIILSTTTEGGFKK